MDLTSLKLNGNIVISKGRIQSGWLYYPGCLRQARGVEAKTGSFTFNNGNLHLLVWTEWENTSNLWEYLVKIILKKLILKTVPTKWYGTLFSISMLFSRKYQTYTSILLCMQSHYYIFVWVSKIMAHNYKIYNYIYIVI